LQSFPILGSKSIVSKNNLNLKSKNANRLPREAVAAPSLAGLKAGLDGALSTLGWWKMSLVMAGGLEPDEL